MSKEELILICAIRYALGRQSYIVGEVCDIVLSVKNKLSRNCINIIIRDIEEEFEMCHRMGRTCGMDCDEAEWQKLLNILKGVFI